MGRADEALHQLVGDVVILGEELARKIEADRARPVLGGDAREVVRDATERVVPGGAPALDHRVQKPSFEPDRLAERCALRAEATEIRRMIGIALDVEPAEPIRPRQHSAADAAISTGRAHRRRGYGAGMRVHADTLPSPRERGEVELRVSATG